ncbi:ATP-binding cassette domain-containing protein, partial [Corynebacterium sp.]
MSDCVLRLDNVTKSFGPVEVIKGVDLTVRRGQVQALLGENGAGKSTLIKMIAGVHEPDSGRILVDGTEV